MEEDDYRKQLIESLNKIKTEKTIQVELLNEVDSKNHKLDVEELRIIIWNEFMCGRIDLN
jgi:hypothetical protein